MYLINKYIVTSIFALTIISAGLVTATPQNNLKLIDATLIKYKDFPRLGVDFYDIGGILNNRIAFKLVIDNLVNHYRDLNIDAILAVDSRGFLFATPLAYQLNIPIIMLRKPGKLPGKVISSCYDKEYGSDVIEMQANILQPKQRVIIIDDLVATGGTLRAAIKLAKTAQAEVVEVASIIELNEFKSSRNLNVPVYSVIQK